MFSLDGPCSECTPTFAMLEKSEDLEFSRFDSFGASDQSLPHEQSDESHCVMPSLWDNEWEYMELVPFDKKIIVWNKSISKKLYICIWCRYWIPFNLSQTNAENNVNNSSWRPLKGYFCFREKCISSSFPVLVRAFFEYVQFFSTDDISRLQTFYGAVRRTFLKTTEH